MKKRIKGIFNKLQPSHIAFLLAGVLLAEGFNWLLYKNIKRVTAPGLSSLVTICALVLAIYSAFQVKKWIDNKVNEKGFKKCEEILDLLSDISIGLAYINIKITIALEMNKKIEISQQEFKSDLDKLYDDADQAIQKYLDDILKAHAIQKQLYVWNFDINPDFDTWDIFEKALNYSDALNVFYFSMVKNEYKMEYDIKQLDEPFSSVITSIKIFHKNRFEDIFISLPPKNGTYNDLQYPN